MPASRRPAAKLTLAPVARYTLTVLLLQILANLVGAVAADPVTPRPELAASFFRPSSLFIAAMYCSNR